MAGVYAARSQWGGGHGVHTQQGSFVHRFFVYRPHGVFGAGMLALGLPGTCFCGGIVPRPLQSGRGLATRVFGDTMIENTCSVVIVLGNIGS